MKSLFDVCAPAKLNLFLHIVGRRPDGYHLLESVFALIDWCDTLHFELRNDGQLSREDLGSALPDQDLVLRAASALQQFSGTRHGAHIAINKRIPAEAGMGGGSSDAASTLLALNRLWGLKLDLASLLGIGLKLGADVPFFLAGKNAFVTGIGEKLMPISVPLTRYLVVKPAEGLETRRIFSHPLLKRDTQPTIIAGFATSADGFGRNDLQEIAMQQCPGIGSALNWLDRKGLSGQMTGSGSAVFARLPHDVETHDAPRSFQVKVCSSLSEHPLIGWAD
ncbi:MAG: 4-(cytidine 5'-diphospho)-2-C-methyl-D-erythritol kinase [Rhodoferax sp.]|jgi:4-diphosphocytidyl-2-C-methyl-D-erythritol kinase|nr:4-(cytidine 5'-diphospho)-2-C-methyl-D-erythritol kinase [Rhodoferax sp.]